MGYTFRPAITSEAKPLIGIYAESGAGKTFSALLLAKGFAGDMTKVGMIETESGRGEVYADDPVVGGYNVLPLRDEFSSKSYGAAIDAAGKAGIKVLIIDSASHEWEGAGGVLSMAADNQAAGKKGPIVWQQPKMQHQREFMLKLMQTPVPLVIVCMRAKYPMREVVRDGKKEWARSESLEPKQADDILFEMMVHGWCDQAHNFHVTKYTKDSFKTVFIDNKPIDEGTGKRLAAWASGALASGTDHTAALQALLRTLGVSESSFLAAAKRDNLREITDFGKAVTWIEAHKPVKKAAPDVQPEKQSEADATTLASGEKTATTLESGKPSEISLPATDDLQTEHTANAVPYINVVAALRGAGDLDKLEAAAKQIPLVAGEANQLLLKDVYGSCKSALSRNAPRLDDPLPGELTKAAPEPFTESVTMAQELFEDIPAAEGMIYAKVADMINSASSVDVLELTLDFINQVQDGAQRLELREIYSAKESELTE